jgi:NOL1/NOP2/fmu family ribosome biogenesis protein
MQNLTILNTKQKKEIFQLLDSQWGIKQKLDYIFLRNSEGRLFIINKDLEKIDESKLRINSMGLYFGELRNNELRLTIEGSQIIGSSAKKNIYTLNNSQFKDWLAGKDIEAEHDHVCFLLMKHKKDFIGTGKYKEGKILNFIPKARRLSS